MTRFCFFILLIYPFCVFSSPEVQPIPRNGACPAGYHISGAYCVPGNHARYAIIRNGSCPTGYYSSGNYCV